MAKITLDKILSVESVSSNYYPQRTEMVALSVSVIQVSQVKLIDKKRIRVPSQIRFPGVIHPDSVGSRISYEFSRRNLDYEAGFSYFEDTHVLHDLTLDRKYVAKRYLRRR